MTPENLIRCWRRLRENGCLKRRLKRSPKRRRTEDDIMIRYALKCVGDHRFEAWFSNSEAFDKQRKRKLVECPECGSHDVSKQIMAPAVRASGQKVGGQKTGADKSDRNTNPEAMAAKVAGEIRQHIASTHAYVGDKFADEARSMFYGETDTRPVWGEVTPDVARELHEEGVPALPLPKPFAPDKPREPGKLN
jgi:hypothetical protein